MTLGRRSAWGGLEPGTLLESWVPKYIPEATGHAGGHSSCPPL